MKSILHCSTTLNNFDEMIEICQYKLDLHIELIRGSDIISEPTLTTGWGKTDIAWLEI